uniref:Uncharacterized protein LOC111106341 isoform X1 n=1 Tax=Crassostrea virginica TaxID=6565 RepID=A0A8B8AZV9_CRAVI|nr:uncharacterized protein LOC111106341 isoform X1 [Crassostrea virginica]
MSEVFSIFSLLVLIHWTTINFAALPTWVHRVHKCPDPNRLRDWLEAAKKLNCLHNLTSNDIIEQKRVYHCLPSSFLNETVEFCGENVPIESGKCPVYNYAVHQNTRPTSYNCSKFVSGCPQEAPSWSKEVYKYPACLNLNKIEKCFEAEKDCKNSSDNGIPMTDESGKTGIPMTDEPGKTGIPMTDESGKTGIPMTDESGKIVIIVLGTLNGILLFGGLVIVIIVTRNKIRACKPLHRILSRTGSETFEDITGSTGTELQQNEQDGENNNIKKYKIEELCNKAKAFKDKEFVFRLKEAMTQKQCLCIKQRLQEDFSEDMKISNPIDLVNYLQNERALFHNMTYAQGLFLACGAEKLHHICVEHAKKRKDQQIIYFEKKKKMPGFIPVEYTIHCPDQNFTEEDVTRLRETVCSLTKAKYNDIFLQKVKQGSIIVTFMIRKDLIPALRSHYQPETTHKTTKHMSKVLKRKIIKVAIDDDIVYPTNDTASSNGNADTTTSKDNKQISAEHKDREMFQENYTNRKSKKENIAIDHAIQRRHNSCLCQDCVGTT